jgi:hypothetical protein
MQPLPLEPIRQAVDSGEFERAQLLWNQCAAGMAEDLGRGSLDEARLKEVRALVEWSRVVILCARAHLLNEINSLHVAGEYEIPVPQSAPRLVEATF